MVKISNASYENEIHSIDNPFERGFQKKLFRYGDPNFGGRTAGKFRENGRKQENSLLCKLGSDQF